MKNQQPTTPTLTRTEANRENAHLSTGPKDTTSTRFNATKHGLLAEGVTELDSPEKFNPLLSQLEFEMQPVGEVERFIVRRIALCMVRLRRVPLLEAEFITAKLNPPVTKKDGGWVDGELEKMNGKTVVIDPGLPASFPTAAMDALSGTFARYETTMENRLHKNLNLLERLQRARRGEIVPPPASLDVSVHTDTPAVASFGNPPPQGEE